MFKNRIQIKFSDLIISYLMVRNGNNVSICIWYEMVMVRNGNGTKWLWYENDFHYGTKWLWYEMTNSF